MEVLVWNLMILLPFYWVPKATQSWQFQKIKCRDEIGPIACSSENQLVLTEIPIRQYILECLSQVWSMNSGAVSRQTVSKDHSSLMKWTVRLKYGCLAALVQRSVVEKKGTLTQLRHHMLFSYFCVQARKLLFCKLPSGRKLVLWIKCSKQFPKSRFFHCIKRLHILR